MVLLPEPSALSVEALQAAFTSYGGETLSAVEEKEGVVSFNLGSGTGAITVVPMPIPSSDLAPVAETSLLWPEASQAITTHHAHALVTIAHRTGTQVERKLHLTRLVAAVVEATHAIGVYWGEGPALHSSAEFLDSTRTASISDPPVHLWLGLSIARPNQEQVSLLTFGMEHFHQTNLLVIGPSDNTTVAFVYDLAKYMLISNVTINDGDTVGHSPTQRIQVRHQQSPVDSTQTVYAVELPPDFSEQ